MAPLPHDYESGFGLPADVLFDVERTRRVLSNKWFFVGTSGDIPRPRDFLTFRVLEEEYVLVRSGDGEIQCFVNRCSHQSARLFGSESGQCKASIVCPNHQWSYHLDGGRLRTAAGMGPDFVDGEVGKRSALTTLPVRSVAGMIFACLDPDALSQDLDEIAEIVAPYTNPFELAGDGYKLAHHSREVIDSNWLLVMINNRECCHCRVNHKRLTKLFDPSSFNGASTAAYRKLFDRAVQRWDQMGLTWREQAFEPNDCCRVARYPLQEGFASITFDGAPASTKLIGRFESHESSTLSIWPNPNAWVHFTSDHIATNWVLPLDADHCTLYTSWIVRSDAIEGEDYDIDHLTEVWNITNAEDVGLCRSMTEGARSRHYRPGPFSPDEKFCIQFCDWFMRYSD